MQAFTRVAPRPKLFTNSTTRCVGTIIQNLGFFLLKFILEIPRRHAAEYIFGPRHVYTLASIHTIIERYQLHIICHQVGPEKPKLES